MSMDPGVVNAAWMTVLGGDATLTGLLPGGIHDVRPPVDTPFPWLRFRLMASPNEVWTFGGGRILRMRYQVDVADQAESSTAARAALARADVLLSDAAFSPSSGAVLFCRREGFPPDTGEEVEGVPFQMVHATYLVEAIP